MSVGHTEKSGVLYDIKVIGYLFRGATEVSKSYSALLVLSILVKAMSPLVWVIGPRFILDELTGQMRLAVLMGILGAFLGAAFLLDALSRLLDALFELKNQKVLLAYQRKLSQKAMELDYPYLENPTSLDLKEKAVNGLNYSGGAYGVTDGLVRLLSSLITLITLVSMILSLNIFLTLMLLGIVILITVINNRLRVVVYKFWDMLQVFNRKFRYLNDLMFYSRYDKDLRLFHMEKMLGEKNEEYRRQTFDYYVGQGKRELKFLALINLTAFLQTLLVYGFTSVLACNGTIGIPDFVMYLSAATSLVAASTAMTRSVIDLKRVSQYTGSFYEFCLLPPIKPVGTKALPASSYGPKGMPEIRFENVTFTYPGTEKPVLRNVSLRLIPGEKLSIVGLNGAGKTTLVKLLLRLFDPDEGAIFVDGTDIREIKYEEYLKLFSVVFQDYQLFAASVAENVGASAGDGIERLQSAFEKANLTEVVEGLPKREETQIFKIFDESGVELSGGQGGRLALARAIYKDAPVVVLDEPTAALDPIAEYEIYLRFHELVQGRTTIYISHRLSSCRFCDGIAVFADGEIVEYGTHLELAKRENGVYAQMWQAQAQYYVDKNA